MQSRLEGRIARCHSPSPAHLGSGHTGSWEDVAFRRRPQALQEVGLGR